MVTDGGLSPEDRISALETRVAQLEAALAAATAPQPQTVQPQVPPQAHMAHSQSAQPPPPPPRAPAATHEMPWGHATEPEKSRFGEALSTEAVLKWAGLVLVFLAAAFLVSTAIDRGWIGPELQLAGVIALGLAMIAGGLRILEQWRGWARSLVAVGVAILYIAAFASHEWLNLVWLGVATIGSIVVTLGSIWLARQCNSRLVAIVGYLGAIVTPAGLGAADEYGVGVGSAYLLVVAIAFLLLHIERSWTALYLVVGVLSMLVGYAATTEHELVGVGQVMLALLALALILTPVAHELRHGEAETDIDRLPTRLVLAVPVWFWGATIELHEIDSGIGRFAIAAATCVAVLAIAMALQSQLSKWHCSRWQWASLLLAASIVLVAGFSSLLDGPALLGTLALQALAMMLLTRVVDDAWFRIGSVVLAVFVFVVTAGRTVEAVEIDASLGADLVHLGVFAATGAIGWMVRDRSEGEIVALGSYGGLIVWVLSALVHISQGQVIVSAIWAVIGVAVVLIGLSRRRTHVAWVGMATLALVVGKLLTVDLAEVDTFWRAGLFFLVGAGFLWLSTRIPALTAGDTTPSDDEPTAP